MTRKIFILLCFFVSNVFTYADIIDYVAIVRPVPGEGAAETYTSVANWLENSRNSELAESFEFISENSGFGSGFLIRGKDDKLYLITNFHVISQSDYASVEFQDHNGNSTLIEDCPVVSADENLDLAILLIDEEKTELELKGLSVDTELQLEGTEVWTAGFPGFGADPLWQLAKGSVTNRKARTSELKVNGLDYVIQHSSIIDSGSSGGPLLLSNDKIDGGYAVIGVNTWSARGRDNTYFSIPAVNLVSFLETVPDALTAESHIDILKSSLEDEVKQFSIEFSLNDDDYQSHRRFFSHDFILEKGWDSYLAFRKTMSDSERDDWDHYFFYVSPFNAMKESLYNDVRAYFLGESESRNIRSLRCGEIFSTDSGTFQSSVVFSVNGEDVESTWVVEQGKWRISKLDIDVETANNIVKEEKKNEGLFRNIDNVYSIGIIPGMTISYFDSDYSTLDDPILSGGVGLDLEYYFQKFFGWRSGVGINKYSHLFFDLYSGPIFLLPFSLSEGNLYLTPRFSVTVGTALDLDSFSSLSYVFLPFINFSAGIEMSAGKIKEHLFWGIEFTYTKYLNLDLDFDSEEMHSPEPFIIQSCKSSVYLRWFL